MFNTLTYSHLHTHLARNKPVRGQTPGLSAQLANLNWITRLQSGRTFECQAGSVAGRSRESDRDLGCSRIV